MAPRESIGGRLGLEGPDHLGVAEGVDVKNDVRFLGHWRDLLRGLGEAPPRSPSGRTLHGPRPLPRGVFCSGTFYGIPSGGQSRPHRVHEAARVADAEPGVVTGDLRVV